MHDASLINLIVALARLVPVSPETLAKLFSERGENQKYYDKLVDLIDHVKEH